MDDVFGGKLNFYFEHRVASILVNKDYTELTLHLLQATFFGFSKTQIPENISRWWRRFFRKFSLTRENCLLSKSSWWCFVRGPGPGYKKSLEFQRRSGSWAAWAILDNPCFILSYQYYTQFQFLLQQALYLHFLWYLIHSSPACGLRIAYAGLGWAGCWLICATWPAWPGPSEDDSLHH